MTTQNTTTKKPFLEAKLHGDIQRIFDDIYLVTGTFTMTAPITMSFSRNMTIVREAEELTLVNSVRLSEEGLKQLDKLGKVKNIIRIAGFHGCDDPFYKDRYGAKDWSVDSPYAAGVEKNPKPEDIYFKADAILKGSDSLPLKGAEIIVLKSCSPSEGLLLLHREKGVLVAGDCLQNWEKPDQYFSFLAKLMMRMMGLIKPYNVGPAWLKVTSPDAQEIKDILKLDFKHVIPAHGQPVINEAKKLFGPAISRVK